MLFCKVLLSGSVVWSDHNGVGDFRNKVILKSRLSIRSVTLKNLKSYKNDLKAVGINISCVQEIPISRMKK